MIDIDYGCSKTSIDEGFTLEKLLKAQEILTNKNNNPIEVMYSSTPRQRKQYLDFIEKLSDD